MAKPKSKKYEVSQKVIDGINASQATIARANQEYQLYLRGVIDSLGIDVDGIGKVNLDEKEKCLIVEDK